MKNKNTESEAANSEEVLEVNSIVVNEEEENDTDTDYGSVIKKAEEFATLKHKGQMYGDKPYTFHLETVVSILFEHGYEGEDDEENRILVAGWLHDTLEDTETTYKEIEREFGGKIARTVLCVTNEPGIDRIARLKKTAPKIASEPSALIVKLADRIANSKSSLLTSPGLYRMYCREWDLFRSLLLNKQEIDDNPRLLSLWNRLSKSYE